MTRAKAEHWQQRAAAARAQAELMNDPIARQSMLQIAESYERMAARSRSGPRMVALPFSSAHEAADAKE